MNHHSYEFADLNPSPLTIMLHQKIREFFEPHFNAETTAALRRMLPDYSSNAVVSQETARKAHFECLVIAGRLDLSRAYGLAEDVRHYERALIKSQEKCRAFYAMAHRSYETYTQTRDWIDRRSTSRFARLLKGWSK